MTRRALLGGAAALGAAAAAGRSEARERRSPPPDAVGMLFDSTRCIGCRACVTRCREANRHPPVRAELGGGLYDAPSDLDATTRNVIKLAALGERTAFAKAQCMHCVDPACTSVCMIKALHKAPGGIVAYDEDHCVGCRYCQVACPFNVPKFAWGSAVPRIVKCELCRHRADPKRSGPLALANPACCEVCPREAVIYGRRDELLLEAHRRLSDDPTRYQPKVYGETDAGGTQVLYLSARGVSFDRLGLPDVGPDPAPELSETIQHGIYYGMIAPAALFAVAGMAVARSRRRQGEEGHR